MNHDASSPETQIPPAIRCLQICLRDSDAVREHSNRLYWDGSARGGARSITEYLELHGEEVRRRYLAWVHELGETRVLGRCIRERFLFATGSSLWPFTVFAEHSIWKQRTLEQLLKCIALEMLLDAEKPKQLEFVGSEIRHHRVFQTMCALRGVRYAWRRGRMLEGRRARRWLHALPQVLQGAVALVWFASRGLSLRSVRQHGTVKGECGLLICGQLFNFKADDAVRGGFISQFWGSLPDAVRDSGRALQWLHIFCEHDKVPTARRARELIEPLNSRLDVIDRHTLADSYLSLIGLVRIAGRWMRIAVESIAVGMVLRSRRNRPGVERFWPLMRTDWGRALQGFGCIASLYYLECFDRALARLPHQNEGIYLMENQDWERALILAWRRHGHGRLTAVAHSTIRFWDLRYHTDPRRYDTASRTAFPLPDVVVVNGPAAREAYLATSVARERVVECEALRYMHLPGEPLPAAGTVRRDGPVRLLVLGDYLREVTSAMLRVVQSARANANVPLEVTIKPHPNCPVTAADCPGLQFTLANEPVAELAKGFDLTLASNMTSSSLDAYVSGGRVLVLDERNGVNFSPLRSVRGVPFIQNAEALLSTIERAAGGNFVYERQAGQFFTIDPMLPRWREYLRLHERRGQAHGFRDATRGRTVPRVSIIVPTYNRAADVARCLDSIVDQTFTDFEVLICDDGSTDHTAEVVERYKDSLELSYHWSPNWGGPARPRNVGLRLARGEYVAFLDSDDWWAPRKLERSIAALDGGADVVYHDLYLTRTRTRTRSHRLFRARTRSVSSPVYQSLIEWGNALTNSSVVARRELLLEIGGFIEDPRLIAWEDFDCWLRLARITDKFTRLSEPLGWYWSGGGNVTSPRRALLNLERIREIHLQPAGLDGDDDLPGWFHYGIARASYHLRDFARARRHVRLAMCKGLRPSLRTKALLTLGGSLLRGRG